MDQENQILTMYQVAEYLKLHPLTVRRRKSDGAIPAFKVGRLWRVQKDMLDQWMETQAWQNLGALHSR